MEVEERDRLLLQINDNVVELRTVVLGTNGFRGMQGMIEDMGVELGEAKGAIVDINQKLLSYRTVNGCEDIHTGLEKRAEDEKKIVVAEKKEVDSKKERRKMTTREWLTIIIAAMGVASTAIIALVK